MRKWNSWSGNGEMRATVAWKRALIGEIWRAEVAVKEGRRERRFRGSEMTMEDGGADEKRRGTHRSRSTRWRAASYTAAVGLRLRSELRHNKEGERKTSVQGANENSPPALNASHERVRGRSSFLDRDHQSAALYLCHLNTRYLASHADFTAKYNICQIHHMSDFFFSPPSAHVHLYKWSVKRRRKKIFGIPRTTQTRVQTE